MHRLLIAALAICLSPAGYAALEFTGYMRSKDVLQFVVTDLDSGATSGWLAIGGAFEGYKVTAFEERQEVLVLEQGSKSTRLPLKRAQVRDGKTAPPEKIEVQLKVSPDGTLVIDDQAVSAEAFEALLRKYAERNAPLVLYFQQPWDPGPKVHETLERVLRAVPKSGVKKYSLTILDPLPPKK